MKPRSAYAVLLLCLAFASPCQAQQEEELTDIVFALDTSGSMTTDNHFGIVTAKLIEFVTQEVEAGTHVALITFGDAAQLVDQRELNEDKDRAELVARIRKLEPTSRSTHMTAGMELALKTLNELAAKHPKRNRIVVLLTDGEPEPKDQKPTFAELLTQYGKRPDFIPGQDWFFWYCFIGNADPAVRGFARALNGEEKPVTGAWQFIKIRFNRAVLKLGDLSTGDFQVEYPNAQDREAGESLQVETRVPGEYHLEFGEVFLADAVAGETLTVTPEQISMNKGSQSVVLTFRGHLVTTGERRARVAIRCPGKMAFVKPQRFTIQFRFVKPVEPRVDVVPADVLDFGMVEPGRATVRDLILVPNEAAAALAGTVEVEPVAPLPAGVHVVAEPPTLTLDDHKTIRISLKVDAAAGTAEGIQGRLALRTKGKSALALPVDGIPWRARLSKAVVMVAPATVLDFGTVAADSPQKRSFSLTPNEAAVEVKPELSFAAADFPIGTTVSFEPERVVMDRPREVMVILKAGAKAGEQTGRVVLTNAKENVHLGASSLAVRFVTEPAGIHIDAKEFNFGEFPAGSGKKSLAVSIAASQQAMKRSIRAQVLFQNPFPGQMTAVVVPQTFSLAQAQQTVEFGLTLEDTQAGKYAGTITFQEESTPGVATGGLPPLRIEPEQIPIVFDIFQPSVKVTGVPDAWVLRKGFLGDDRAELPLRFESVRLGEEIEVRLGTEGLPSGIEIEPTVIRLTPSSPGQDVKLTASVRMTRDLMVGSRKGELLLSTQTAGAVVLPDRIVWRLSLVSISELMVLALGLFALSWLAIYRILVIMRPDAAMTCDVDGDRETQKGAAGRLTFLWDGKNRLGVGEAGAATDGFSIVARRTIWLRKIYTYQRERGTGGVTDRNEQPIKDNVLRPGHTIRAGEHQVEIRRLASLSGGQVFLTGVGLATIVLGLFCLGCWFLV
jgi:hypothetical protein